MVKYYKTDDRKIHEEDGPVDGVWIDMCNPTVPEGEEPNLAEKDKKYPAFSEDIFLEY